MMMESMIVVFIGCFFLGSAQARCLTCNRTLFFHKDVPQQNRWREVLTCQTIDSCCVADEQQILKTPQITYTIFPNGIQISTEVDGANNYINVILNPDTIDFEKLVLNLQYPYSCRSQPKEICRDQTQPFFQNMSLTLRLIEVKLEVLECANDSCTINGDGQVNANEESPMKFKCSANLPDGTEYWMAFHGGTSGSRVARCVPYTDPGHEFETGDPGWKVHRNSNTSECILEIQQCRMKDMGIYVCVLHVPYETNRYHSFHSVPKLLSVKAGGGESTNNKGLLIGGIITGSIVGVLIVVGIMVGIGMIIRKRWYTPGIRRPYVPIDGANGVAPENPAVNVNVRVEDDLRGSNDES